MILSFNKALVTGGAGFIGSHLVDALLSMDCEVVVIDDLSKGNLANLEQCKEYITFYHGDIRDQGLLDKAARGCDIIFHHAAVVSVPLSVENPVDSAMVNELGTLFVLEAARKNGVKRVIIASSSAVYGDDPALPKHEDMAPKPQNPYAVQKLTGEYYAQLYTELYDVETVCLRYFNVYGPRQDPSSPYSGVISIFLAKASAKDTPVIYGDGQQYRDFIFVKDAVTANLISANSGTVGDNIFNVGTGKFVRINQLWDMIGELAGHPIEPDYEPPRQGDIVESVASIDRIKNILGFEPEYTLEKGLETTFNDYLTKNESE
ncbi:SDR family oxidoreductase [Thermodesulfobacteriota bacterium]